MNLWCRWRYLSLVGCLCFLTACSTTNAQTSSEYLVQVSTSCSGKSSEPPSASAQASQDCATVAGYTVQGSELATSIPRIYNDILAEGRTITSFTVSQEDSSGSIVLTGPGQVLPITAQAIIAGEPFDLEVAQTSRQQQLGLMFREALPDNRGMLFPFRSPRPARFWMKNVPVGLDMVFLYRGEVQGIVEAPPCEADPCPTYGPGNLLVDNVIELRIGRAAELGLQEGDQVEIMFLE